MSTPILRDPATGRFISSKPKKELVDNLAHTMIYVVCLCTLFFLLVLISFYFEVHRLQDQVRKLQEAAPVFILEMPESELEPLPAPPAGELDGAPDPVSVKEKPRQTVRVFRGSEAIDYEL